MKKLQVFFFRLAGLGYQIADSSIAAASRFISSDLCSPVLFLLFCGVCVQSEITIYSTLHSPTISTSSY